MASATSPVMVESPAAVEAEVEVVSTCPDHSRKLRRANLSLQEVSPAGRAIHKNLRSRSQRVLLELQPTLPADAGSLSFSFASHISPDMHPDLAKRIRTPKLDASPEPLISVPSLDTATFPSLPQPKLAFPSPLVDTDPTPLVNTKHLVSPRAFQWSQPPISPTCLSPRTAFPGILFAPTSLHNLPGRHLPLL
ncbi:hypothetical protein BCR44DRAFT_1316295 [Catenaria anguillulae PL171]|uniref:Uncharacterized protein n=1 Tax=Catenaria anguillulae PL171 TaxID=765915 RepID=A0A1Y2H6Z3_9FUNG|nr:hypothetical protein BCR44DRAFT_1316295 [Catenaria anguillulae PL171]